MTLLAESSTQQTAAKYLSLLRDLLQIPSVSGEEGKLTRFVADWARSQGFEVDLWETREADLAAYPESKAKHLPLNNRPTAVIRLPGTGGGRSLMFNAHADVVSAGDLSQWKHGPWSGDLADGKVFGRGACDVKGPLVSALWAMTLLADSGQLLAGDVLLELVPGEEDCVGLGTLTSVVRGWKADACIVLEPTESQPRCASRGGVRFEVTSLGRAVHGTVKWLGRDAIATTRHVLDALDSLQSRWNDLSADPLFSSYPIARPITVDKIHGGEWQGMVCDRCTVAGYLELLPANDIATWQKKFETELRQLLGRDAQISVQFSEQYSGHRTDPNEPLCQAVDHTDVAWQGFNSGCEAGLRARVHGTPTLVWGPGSLAQAHAPDEFVCFEDVRKVAEQFVRVAKRWGNTPTV